MAYTTGFIYIFRRSQFAWERYQTIYSRWKPLFSCSLNQFKLKSLTIFTYIYLMPIAGVPRRPTYEYRSDCRTNFILSMRSICDLWHVRVRSNRPTRPTSDSAPFHTHPFRSTRSKAALCKYRSQHSVSGTCPALPLPSNLHNILMCLLK